MILALTVSESFGISALGFFVIVFYLVIKSMVKNNPKLGQKYYERGCKSYEEGKYKEAIKFFNKARYRRAPMATNENLYRLRGLAKQKIGKHKDAESDIFMYEFFKKSRLAPSSNINDDYDDDYDGDY